MTGASWGDTVTTKEGWNSNATDWFSRALDADGAWTWNLPRASNDPDTYFLFHSNHLELVKQVTSDASTSVTKIYVMSFNMPADACYLNQAQKDALCSAWSQGFYNEENMSSTCSVASQSSSNTACDSDRLLREDRGRRLAEVLTVEVSAAMTSSRSSVDGTGLANIGTSLVSNSFVTDAISALTSASIAVTFSSAPVEVGSANGGGGVYQNLWLPCCKFRLNHFLFNAFLDPHFKALNGQFFLFHGLAMLHSPGFAIGRGLLIHIRTTRVNNNKMNYSYISGVALKISTDVLEVSADGSLVVNENPVDSGGLTRFSAYPFAKKFKGTKNNIIVYHLNLGTKNQYIQIRANTKTGMLFVDVSGNFPDSSGLLGASDKGVMARDGMTDLTGALNTFGEEWQVNSADPKLFMEDREPQSQWLHL